MIDRRKAMAIKYLYSIPYNIEYELNGGTLSLSNPSSYTIETSELSFNDPYRDGYTFLGWTMNDNTEFINSLKFGTHGDIKLSAHFGKNMASDEVSSNVIDLTVDCTDDKNVDGIDDNISASFISSGSMEKLNFPIEGLISGQKYNLTCIESNNANYGSSSGYYNSMYGFFISNSKTTSISTVFKEDARSQGGLIAEWVNGESGGINILDGKNFNGPRTIDVDFVATNTTMYWTWDYGLTNDGVMYTYNLNDISITPVPPEIDFESMALKDDTTYVATFNIISCDSNNLTFTFSFDGNSGVELLYIPITGLTTGAKYSITFNHSFSGKFINGDGGTYDYGCGILKDITNASLSAKMSSVSSSWLSNTWTMNEISNSTESITLTFTANSETLYWVWNMGNVSDSVVATINLSITGLSVVHSSGGSITFI